MDFETRQKQAVEEINEVMKKYGLALQAFLNAQPTGILPGVRLVDVQAKEEVTETKQEDVKEPKTKKGKK